MDLDWCYWVAAEWSVLTRQNQFLRLVNEEHDNDFRDQHLESTIGGVEGRFRRSPAEGSRWGRKRTFINAISTLQMASALLKELRTALLSRKIKKAVVSNASRSTAIGGGPKASQPPPGNHAGKRKANELASSGDPTEPTNRRPWAWRPAPGAGSALLPAFTYVRENKQP